MATLCFCSRTAWVQKIKAASEQYIDTEKRKREKAYQGSWWCPGGLAPAGAGEGLTLPLGGPGVGEGLTLGANCCSCRDGNTDVLKDQTPPPDPSRFKPPGTSLSTHPTTHWGHPVPQELLLSVAKSLSLRPQHSFFTPVSRKKGPLCTPSPTSAWSVVLHPAFLGGLFPF